MVLPGNGIPGFRDTYPVIRKLRVHTWQLNLWHVTGRTFLCAHRTSGCAAMLSLCVFRFGEVARETLGVVICHVLLQLLMRIVAG